MKPKVLIVEETPQQYSNGYILCCVLFDYEYQVCHDAEQLPEILESFRPNIVFWILSEEIRSREINSIDKTWLHDKNLKVVLAYDFEMYPVGERQADVYLLPQAHIVPDRFQRIITEQFFTNIHDEPSLDKWVNKLEALPELSDNALRAIAAERIRSGDQSYLERLLERKNRGDKLNKEALQNLAELIKAKELLLQRKVKAAEILINRGFTETMDELMNPRKG